MVLTNFSLGEGQIKVVVWDENNQSAFDIINYIIDSHPEQINQSLELNSGWNLFSPSMEGDLITSDNLDSYLVLGYKEGEWQKDLSFLEGDEFPFEAWNGYIIYSKENKSTTLIGYPPTTNRPNLDGAGWNLFSFNETNTFYNLFFSPISVEIFNIFLQNNSFIIERMREDDILTRGEFYWIVPS